VPGFDIENTCIYNYFDLDVNWGTNETYSGDKRISTSIKDMCASQYGTKVQHSGIDTAYLPGSPRIVVSPALGIVTSARGAGFVLLTKLGNTIGIGHMDDIFAVQEGQIIYPGDIIGIGGAIWGDSPRHVHFAYHLYLPYYGKTIPNRPYEDVDTEIIGSNFEIQPSIEEIYENLDFF
jgi:murein DD-endopeptidase MepM/ murein hydrolase activator NlpD